MFNFNPTYIEIGYVGIRTKMYEIYYKQGEFLRTKEAKLKTLQDVEDFMRNRCNWEKYQVKTPQGIIKEVQTMGLNLF